MSDNPLRSVLLNNKWYNFITGSFSQEIPLKNSKEETQSRRTFSSNGKAPEVFAITVICENDYEIFFGNSYVGNTVWNGVSRLVESIDFLGAKGVSLPITFVTPYGVTYSVVPTGSLNISEYLETPNEKGMEFKVTTTLNAI